MSSFRVIYGAEGWKIDEKKKQTVILHQIRNNFVLVADSILDVLFSVQRFFKVLCYLFCC